MACEVENLARFAHFSQCHHVIFTSDNARFLSISHSHFLSYDSCGRVRGISVSVSNPNVHLRLEQPLGVTISSPAWLGIVKSILASLDLQAQQAQTLIGHPLLRPLIMSVDVHSGRGRQRLSIGARVSRHRYLGRRQVRPNALGGLSGMPITGLSCCCMTSSCCICFRSHLKLRATRVDSLSSSCKEDVLKERIYRRKFRQL